MFDGGIALIFTKSFFSAVTSSSLRLPFVLGKTFSVSVCSNRIAFFLPQLLTLLFVSFNFCSFCTVLAHLFFEFFAHVVWAVRSIPVSFCIYFYFYFLSWAVSVWGNYLFLSWAKGRAYLGEIISATNSVFGPSLPWQCVG